MSNASNQLYFLQAPDIDAEAASLEEWQARMDARAAEMGVDPTAYAFTIPERFESGLSFTETVRELKDAAGNALPIAAGGFGIFAAAVLAKRFCADPEPITRRALLSRGVKLGTVAVGATVLIPIGEVSADVSCGNCGWCVVYNVNCSNLYDGRGTFKYAKSNRCFQSGVGCYSYCFTFRDYAAC